jgi:hypothetical protein
MICIELHGTDVPVQIKYINRKSGEALCRRLSDGAHVWCNRDHITIKFPHPAVESEQRIPEALEAGA